MMPFWVEFEDRPSACIEAKTPNEALDLAREFGVVKEVYNLPYPANPRLGERSECPTFCYSGETCKGRRSCPKSYACSE